MKYCRSTLTILLLCTITCCRKVHSSNPDSESLQNLNENEIASFSEDKLSGLKSETSPLLFQLSAQNLPKKDKRGTADPFVQCSYTAKFGDYKTFTNFARTKTLTDEINPEWNDVILFPFFKDGQNQMLRFEVRDNDKFGPDDHIGYGYILVDDCVSQQRKQWARPSIPDPCTSTISGTEGSIKMRITRGHK